jgi:hypothetical protein
MKGLRRISLLLSVALAAVIARMVIDGPKLLASLTGALILVLLLFSLRLRQQGRRLQPGASSETRQGDASSRSERTPTACPHETSRGKRDSAQKLPPPPPRPHA